MKQLVTPQPTDSGVVRGLITALRSRYGCIDMAPIGRSVLGKEIYSLLLGNGRKRIVYAAAFHAQEWMTSLLLLRLCEDIAYSLKSGRPLADIRLHDALQGRCLVLVPLVNPDGVDIALHGSQAADEHAAAVHALGGDTPGLWQANAHGVDINHNFNAGWTTLQALEREKGIDGPAPRQWGGPAPHSEPETQALVRLCRRCDCTHVIALHTQGEEIYYRYGDKTPGRARMMAEVMAVSSGYTVCEPDGLASHGGFKDWFIETYGRPGFTIELGQGTNPLPLEEFEAIYAQTQEMLLLSALM